MPQEDPASKKIVRCSAASRKSRSDRIEVKTYWTSLVSICQIRPVVSKSLSVFLLYLMIHPCISVSGQNRRFTPCHLVDPDVFFFAVSTVLISQTNFQHNWSDKNFTAPCLTSWQYTIQTYKRLQKI